MLTGTVEKNEGAVWPGVVGTGSVWACSVGGTTCSCVTVTLVGTGTTEVTGVLPLVMTTVEEMIDENG